MSIVKSWDPSRHRPEWKIRASPLAPDMSVDSNDPRYSTCYLLRTWTVIAGTNSCRVDGRLVLQRILDQSSWRLIYGRPEEGFTITGRGGHYQCTDIIMASPNYEGVRFIV